MQKNIEGTNRHLYDVTVTRTGSVTVRAATYEEAFDIVNTMTVSEINEKGSLTGWEPSDAVLLEEGE